MNGSRLSWMAWERPTQWPVTGSSDSQQPDLTSRGIYHLIISLANKQSLFWGGLTADQWQIHGIYFTIISWFAKSAFLQVLWSHSYGAVGIQKTFNKETSSLSQHTNRQKLGKFIVNKVRMRFPIWTTSIMFAQLHIVWKLGHPSKQENIKYSSSWYR